MLASLRGDTSCPKYHVHRKSPDDIGWCKDIDYKHAEKYHRQPPLLVADPKRTFLWNEPILYLDQKHYRNFSIWQTLTEFLGHLETVKS